MAERGNRRPAAHIPAGNSASKFGFDDAAAPGDARLTAGPASAPVRQIVFIEGNIANAQSLAAGVAPGVQAVILDPGSNGLQQIAAYLASHDVTGLAAIAIVAHGSDGLVTLGSAMLDADTIPQYQTDLSAIGAALQPGGAIQLYGCDVAQDATGTAFLQQLSAATGGANVAASSHLVGAAAEGGSWTLDADVGAVDAANPFTAAALAAFPDELPAATNQLFAAFDNVQGSDLTRIEQIGVTGSSETSTTDIVDGSQSAGASFTDLQGLVIDAPLGRYFAVNSDINTVNQIVAGNVGGGGVTVIYNTPNVTNYEISGLALDQAAGQLYFTQTAVDDEGNINAAQDGIFRVSVNGGAVTPVVTGLSEPGDLALDLTNNLIFVADSEGVDSGVNNLDVYNMSTGTLTVLNSQLSAAAQNELNNNAGLVGVAVDPAAHMLYFTAENGGSTADNFIFSASYTLLPNGQITLGATNTLYSGAGAGDPGSIVIDPQDGIFYVGSKNSQAIDEGSLTHSGTGSVTQVEQLTTQSGVDPNGLFLLSTPALTASGAVTFVQDGSAVTLDPTLTVANADGQELASATVQVAGGTGDILSASIAGTPLSATYDASTETLTLTGIATAAVYQAVLRSVTFNSSNAAAGSRTIDWTVSDGIVSSTTPTSTVTIHDAPTLTAGSTATFDGGGPAVLLDSGLTVADPSSPTLAGAVVTIGGFITGDMLHFINQNGITGSYDTGNGELTLSGTATLADYQAALDSVTYSFAPANGDPSGGGSDTSRTISWRVSDGVATGSDSSTLDIVHAAPVLSTGETGLQSYVENTAIAPALSIGDPDSGGNLTGATVSIAAGFFDGDTLNFTSQSGISDTYDSATGLLTLSGSASLSAYQTALQSVTYSTTVTPPTSVPTPERTITWSVMDGVQSSAPVSTNLFVLDETTGSPPCYCRGTLISTDRGEIPVETLAVGDSVVTLSGQVKPIKWIGFGRTLVTPRNRCDVSPVIIHRSALSNGVPYRDLHITRRHAVLVGKVLVPVEHLINGVSITWDDAARVVEYYHIELEGHDVLLANGAPTESFRDDDSCQLFQNENCRPPCSAPAAVYAPIVNSGRRLERAWRKVASRMGKLSKDRLTRDPGLHLSVGGRRVDPSFTGGGVARFSIERPSEDVRIISRTCIPNAHGLGRDLRRLGVGVVGLTLGQADERRVVPLSADELGAGFHGFEGHIRWTKGAAILPAALFTDLPAQVEIELRLAGELLYPRELEEPPHRDADEPALAAVA